MNMNLLWGQYLKDNVCCLIENSCGSNETNFVPQKLEPLWFLFCHFGIFADIK